ncbi:MAG: M20/M25/M40 family metallo-hydrolase, partial [Actinoplanes sp.]
IADPAQGTTVVPSVVAAGTTTNTVPAHATVAVDVRAWTGAELERIDRIIRGLVPRLSEAGLRVEGGISRYPMEAEQARPLFETLREVADRIGVPPPGGAHAAGASDGNFTAMLGVPTLDGLGAVGGGSHARDEYVDLSRMPERIALLAGLIAALR